MREQKYCMKTKILKSRIYCHSVLMRVHVLYYLFCFTAQVLKVCRTPGPTACTKIKMLHLDRVKLVESIHECTKLFILPFGFTIMINY